MIKARMFVVDEDSLNKTISTNIASIFMPDLTGQQWVKTIADIMADMLQIQVGDYIFLWQTKKGEEKSKIHGVYRAISKPYFDNTDPLDNCPFKIRIERAYEFENPIEEYELLNCPYIRNSLWTIMGKKVANKPRGTSPLSNAEMEAIITLLIGVNPSYRFIPFDPSRIVAVPNELKVDYSLNTPNTSTPSRNTINVSTISFFDSSYKLLYEKVLETIFNMEFANHNSVFFSQLGIDLNKVIWYANYLPYSLEQSEMDYVIIESEDGINYSKIFVLEFLTSNPDESHIKRSAMYSKWVNEAMALGTNFAEPIIICNNSVDFINGEKAPTKIAKINNLNQIISSNVTKYKTKDIKIYKYSFSSTGATFTRKR